MRSQAAIGLHISVIAAYLSYRDMFIDDYWLCFMASQY